MADIGNLEKMGRELKCPICLSLLRSAVSITCNHVFCNSCIVESMKSASSCPVCKIPFRRREVRAAPHMDNLVSIFKSMEVATGTNIVSTQVVPAPKDADGSECVNGWNTFGTLKKSMAQEEIKRKEPSKKKKNSPKASSDSASCSITKPSFPTKKRIHVTPFPESETPTRPGKISKPEDSKNEQNGDIEVDKNKASTSDKPESPSLSPFFWLREEKEDGGSAETLSGPLTLDTPLRHNAPSFSDIKDSDDEIPLNMTPNSKDEALEVFDCEIFEWTQRACSPELCSTPLKKQAKGRQALDQVPEKVDNEDELDTGKSFDKICHVRCENQPVDVDKKKRKSKKGRTSKDKHAKSSNCRKLCSIASDANQEISNNSKELAVSSCQKSMVVKNPPRRRMNNASGKSTQALYPEENSRKTILPTKDGAEIEVSDRQLSKKAKRKEQNREGKMNRRDLGIAGQSTLEITEGSSERKRKRIRRKSDDVAAKKLGEVLSGSANETKTLRQNSQRKDSIKHVLLDGKSKDSNICRELNNKMEHKSMESKHDRIIPNISADRSQNNGAIGTTPLLKNSSIRNNQHEGIEQSGSVGAKKFRKIQECIGGDGFLKKCENTMCKVRCAFCQSDDVTEDSGDMVHYLNGKQVPADFNGGTNVIHSHKNCMEWAPDVYFEDESVFNLTAELARSKRIKCACCGIKGAALGCFEMSCRKSFHFTCAKLIPECRWDNENFVMLCPFHRSSKLPTETSGPQKQSKKRTIPKEPPQVRSSYDCSNIWTWPSGSARKWVLCCSALSAAEKGIVLEFAKLTGVPVSTSWSPSITHVIASTDQSGACKRTLKFLMAILNGKWIVSMDWVKTCMDCMEPVDEQRFEVIVDIHGISEGPRLGRLRVTNRQPKLFNGMRFYLHGDYTKSYRGYLQDLVIAAAGTVLQRKPISRDQQKLLDDCSPIFIVYCPENQQKEKSEGDTSTVHHSQADTQALAYASGGKVVSSAWIIDSIAACKLQPL